MKTFITADTHFFHKNIIEYCQRPFLSVEAMNETIINNWNNVVSNDDEVYHLGDFGFGHRLEPLLRIRQRLKGRITILMGNHDRKKTIQSLGIDIGHNIVEFFRGKTYVVLCHYPMEQWNGSAHGSIHLHGHSHGRSPARSNRLDIGCDCWDYRPISLDVAIGRAKEAVTDGLVDPLAEGRANV